MKLSKPSYVDCNSYFDYEDFKGMQLIPMASLADVEFDVDLKNLTRFLQEHTDAYLRRN